MTLEEIKAYCEEHVSYEPWEHGHDCPFYEHRANNGGCVFGNWPVNWRMEELNEIWEKRNACSSREERGHISDDRARRNQIGGGEIHHQNGRA